MKRCKAGIVDFIDDIFVEIDDDLKRLVKSINSKFKRILEFSVKLTLDNKLTNQLST